MVKAFTVLAPILLAACALAPTGEVPGELPASLRSGAAAPAPAPAASVDALPGAGEAASAGTTARVLPPSAGPRPAAGNDWARRLVDPVTAPYLFETPVIHSSVQPVVLHHEFPETSILKGGNLRVFALQLRYAFTDRLAFIAIKDGFADFNPGGPDDTGYVDLGGGLKYMLYEDAEAGELVTVGLLYEATQGSRYVFQGNGEGGFRPFVSAGWDDGETNAIASVGTYLPIDGDAETQYIDYHLHFSWELEDGIVPLVEINGITYTNDGSAVPLNQDALDYGSVGSGNVQGNDIITGAVGLRWRLGANTDFGIAYEDALTQRRDIFAGRVTADLIHRF